MNFVELLDMGAYNFHVWTSWAVSLLTMITFVVVAKRRNAKIKTDLLRQIKREKKQQD